MIQSGSLPLLPQYGPEKNILSLWHRKISLQAYTHGKGIFKTLLWCFIMLHNSSIFKRWESNTTDTKSFSSIRGNCIPLTISPPRICLFVLPSEVIPCLSHSFVAQRSTALKKFHFRHIQHFSLYNRFNNRSLNWNKFVWRHSFFCLVFNYFPASIF